MAAVFGLVEGIGQVTERLGEGIPPKRHENVDADDNDPSSSSSWMGPQRGDYPDQRCPQPHGDSLFYQNPIPIQIRPNRGWEKKKFQSRLVSWLICVCRKGEKVKKNFRLIRK